MACLREAQCAWRRVPPRWPELLAVVRQRGRPCGPIGVTDSGAGVNATTDSIVPGAFAAAMKSRRVCDTCTATRIDQSEERLVCQRCPDDHRWVSDNMSARPSTCGEKKRARAATPRGYQWTGTDERRSMGAVCCRHTRQPVALLASHRLRWRRHPRRRRLRHLRVTRARTHAELRTQHAQGMCRGHTWVFCTTRGRRCAHRPAEWPP